jgi:uridine kinase
VAAFVIGIGGGSGSGKSAIAEQLRERLAPLSVVLINQDRYFRDSQSLPRHASPDGRRTWPDHNHPDSFDLRSLRADLRAARAGPSDVVIVEGILALHDAEVRDLMDLKVFVEADADERAVRRIRRNLAAGYEIGDVCDFYLDSVRYRHREFCQPTRDHADLVVPGGSFERARASEVLAAISERARGEVARALRSEAEESGSTRADPER